MEQFKNFVVVNCADRKLTEERYFTQYDVTVQSGCALTEQRIGKLFDNEGENISNRNPSYSELTALYWVWKHEKAEYIGWSHYRRFLKLSEDDMEAIQNCAVDIIISEPLPLEGSIEKQWLKFSSVDIWETMLEILKKRSPEYYLTAQVVFLQTNMLFPYCMGIYTWDYFDAYCNWLFPLLEEVYSLIGEKWGVYENRYIAMLGERLHSLYFLHHVNELRYRIAPCTIVDSVERAISMENSPTENEVLQKIEDLLFERRLHSAIEYTEHILCTNSNMQTQNMFMAYTILCLCRYEDTYTDISFCRETGSLQVLSTHYSILMGYLRLLSADSKDKVIQDEFFEYVERNNFTCYALLWIIQNEVEDKIPLLLLLSGYYMKKKCIKSGMACLAEAYGRQENDEDSLLRFEQKMARTRFLPLTEELKGMLK